MALINFPSGLGGVAEWLGSGLQSRVHRFNSGPRLSGSMTAPGRLAQRESASLTRKRSEVQILQRPHTKPLVDALRLQAGHSERPRVGRELEGLASHAVRVPGVPRQEATVEGNHCFFAGAASVPI